MKSKLLSKEELRSILGGASNSSTVIATEGFPCRVVEKDGTVRVTIVKSVEECLAFAGPR